MFKVIHTRIVKCNRCYKDQMLVINDCGMFTNLDNLFDVANWQACENCLKDPEYLKELWNAIK